MVTAPLPRAIGPRRDLTWRKWDASRPRQRRPQTPDRRRRAGGDSHRLHRLSFSQRKVRILNLSIKLLRRLGWRKRSVSLAPEFALSRRALGAISHRAKRKSPQRSLDSRRADANSVTRRKIRHL